MVSLAGLPELTVQHRLGRLYRAGLINRSRPPATIGTSPYHCWLTTFGAGAIGTGPPEAWSDDPAGMLATAALSDLWLAVRDHGAGAGVQLKCWSRLGAGVDYEDRLSSAARVLPVEAELTVGLDAIGGEPVDVLVSARTAEAPVARVQAVLARFAAYLQARPDPLLGIVEALADAPAARRLAPRALAAARQRIVVGVVEPRPAALATAPVWCSAAGRSLCPLTEVLAATAGGRR